MSRRIFLGVTGASGAAYGAAALRALTAAGCEVGVCVSPAGARVIAHELYGEGAGPVADLAGLTARLIDDHAAGPGRARALDLDQLTAPFASGSAGGPAGSAAAPAALIAPCSGSTLAAIAHGAGQNLIHRCADVMLKERRRLVLMPRETPLSLIHIENMAAVTRAGAVVLPAAPGFYNAPRSIDDLVDFMVGRALDLLGVEQRLAPRWGEREPG